MGHVSVSLGNVLLSMCEELARSRYSLRQVLAVSHVACRVLLDIEFNIFNDK